MKQFLKMFAFLRLWGHYHFCFSLDQLILLYFKIVYSWCTLLLVWHSSLIALLRSSITSNFSPCSNLFCVLYLPLESKFLLVCKSDFIQEYVWHIVVMMSKHQFIHIYHGSYSFFVYFNSEWELRPLSLYLIVIKYKSFWLVIINTLQDTLRSKSEYKVKCYCLQPICATRIFIPWKVEWIGPNGSLLEDFFKCLSILSFLCSYLAFLLVPFCPNHFHNSNWQVICLSASSLFSNWNLKWDVQFLD